MTFDVNAARQAAFHKLALQTPRNVTLDGDDLSLLAGALTAFRALGDKNGAPQTMHERFDHQRAVEDLAARLGVTLGAWESTEVVTVPKGDPRWMTLDNGSGEVVRAFSMSPQTWEDWDAAAERDARRFANDPDRCQDCRRVESCRCGVLWAGLPDRFPAVQSWGEMDGDR